MTKRINQLSSGPLTVPLRAALHGELERSADPVADGRSRIGSGHLVSDLVLHQGQRQGGGQPAVLARGAARDLPQGGQSSRHPGRPRRRRRGRGREAAAPECPGAAGWHGRQRGPASRCPPPAAPGRAARVSHRRHMRQGNGHLAADAGVGVLGHPIQQDHTAHSAAAAPAAALRTEITGSRLSASSAAESARSGR